MADAADNSNKRLKNRRKRSIKKGVFLVPKTVAVFAIVFLLISVFFRSGSSVNTFAALKGSIEEYVSSDGYIFLDRTLVESPTDGYFECVADEGERIVEGATLATVYKNKVDPAVTEEIADIHKKIDSIESDRVSADVYSGSAVKIEVDIADHARSMSRKRSAGRFSDIQTERMISTDLFSPNRPRPKAVRPMRSVWAILRRVCILSNRRASIRASTYIFAGPGGILVKA